MSKRKRAKCAGPTRDDSNKLRHISTGQGTCMFKMAESMDNVAKAMAPPSPPPESKPRIFNPQAEAIKYIESHGRLSDIEFANAFELFLADVDFANGYMELQTDSAHVNVLCNRLAKLGEDRD